MIMLWGSPDDPVVSAVSAALSSGGHLHVIAHDGDQDFGRIHVEQDTRNAQTIELVGLPYQVYAAFVRPGWARTAANRRTIDALWLWADLADVLVINRPSSMLANGSKLIQSQRAADVGFETPPTIVTNDRDALRAFADQHGSLIYKSASGVRSIVRELNWSDEAQLERLRTCVTLFQQRIAGADVRVHVCGSQTVATRIESSAVDYRYAGRDGLPVSLQRTEIPQWVEQACHAIAANDGLVLAGIDLRVTPDGRWFCFEANPAPAFTFYDVDGSIAVAVAETLADF
jgi:glutathione synthase/RimK-type ligase-like ATP-grasp enzyme